MAQLAPLQQEKIDREIDLAIREWERLPEVEATIDGWPEDDALDLVFEWTLAEDRLDRLAGHAERGELTDQQWQQYEQLEALVRRHRPIVERLISA
jgi:hypothetical protein